MAELLGRDDLKVISCHLGGSSSLCAIRDGKSVACSLGMSPQSGLPHNNRVGDFDVFALPVLLRETGLTLEQVLDILANKSGLEGMSGAGRDLRDIEAAAEAGNADGARWPSTCSSPRPAITSAPTSSSSAGPTRSSSPAGSARTRSGSASGVCRDLDWFGIAARPRPATPAARPSARSRPPARASQVWTVPDQRGDRRRPPGPRPPADRDN